MLYICIWITDSALKIFSSNKTYLNKMDTKQIFIFAFIILFVGFRLYQKYYKKNTGGSNSATGKSGSTGSAFNSSLKDDDYEPYSKK
jgi:spore maturation protein CgeB